MPDSVQISLVEIVGSAVCVAAEDGEKVFGAIRSRLEQGQSIEISFRGVEDVTSLFLNAAIGQLYGAYSEDQIRSRLRAVDISQEDLQTLKRSVDRAKAYFRDPHSMKRAIEGILGEDDGDDR